MSRWKHILTAAEIDSYFNEMHDRGFAARQRRFYETRSPIQLDVLAHQAWMTSEGEAYQIARSFAALAR